MVARAASTPTLPQVQKPQNPPSCFQTICDKIKIILRFIFYPFIALFNCFFPINPVTNSREFRLIPTCLEKFIGKAAYGTLVVQSGGEIFESDPKYGHYATLVKEVGAALVAQCPRKDLDYEFKLIDSSKDNAWCLPGGKIGINLGLIKKMENDTNEYGIGFNPTLKEKIAAVLSHEITHAAARHGGRTIEFSLLLFGLVHAVKYALSYFARRRYDKQIEETHDPSQRAYLRLQQAHATENCFAFLNNFGSYFISGLKLCGSRKHEFEADKYGMHLFAKVREREFTQNSPKAAIWLMAYFQKHHSTASGIGWLDCMKNLCSTHPTPEERLIENQKTWQALQIS